MIEQPSGGDTGGRVIRWYRTAIGRDELKALNERSDLLGFLQSVGHLALLAATGALAWYSAGHWHVGITVALVFAHGTIYAFMINAVHELGHKTVFRTRWLNSAFEHLFAFMGWINHRMFWTSHLRHHRYTLHPPDDLEVVLPVKHTVRDFLHQGFINLKGLRWTFLNTLRIARGKFQGEWELKRYPAEAKEERQAAINWARTILFGHLLIIAVSVYFKLWMLPLLTTFAPFIGGWLFYLCNNTQHVGLHDNVPDFRLCCRTIRLNPLVQFLYWHMNYHTEHHMYPGVPCYRLGRLHRQIQHDMPKTVGLFGAWKQIAMIFRMQREDPGYCYTQALPRP